MGRQDYLFHVQKYITSDQITRCPICSMYNYIMYVLLMSQAIKKQILCTYFCYYLFAAVFQILNNKDNLLWLRSDNVHEL